jgi:hypothetical protein
MVILTTFGACTKNALEEEPFSFISSETLYSTDGGAQAALTGCYSVLADYGGFGAGYPTLTMIASGGFYTSQAAASDLNALTFGASTLWLTNNSPWDQFYNAIKVANDIITNLPKGSASEKTKQAVMGEAYFLRGMLYFNLVRMFGGVPKRIAPVTINDIDIARSSADEIYQLVIEDLEKAKTMMPEPAAQLKGRPHKFAANSLLGKVYLTQAGNDPTSPYWQKAKDELLVVYNSNAYELQKSFALVFDINNENNKESIVEIQYAISGGPNGQWTNFHTPTGSTLTPLATNGPFGRNRVNKEIFDAHRARYATDPRIDVSYVYNQYTRNTGGTQSVYPANTGNQGFPYIKKFVDPAYVSTNSNRNFMYLRYADVLLMLAECENEISGPDQAYQYVNKVLTRARDAKGDGTTIATTPANWSGMTKDEFRNRIMLERRYELIGECHLWFDVRRRGKEIFLQFLRDHNSYPKLNLSFDKIYPVNERLMLFPIPDKEISANALINPQDQNPGY